MPSDSERRTTAIMCYRGLFPSPPLFDRMPTYRTQGKRSLNFLSAFPLSTLIIKIALLSVAGAVRCLHCSALYAPAAVVVAVANRECIGLRFASATLESRNENHSGHLLPSLRHRVPERRSRRRRYRDNGRHHRVGIPANADCWRNLLLLQARRLNESLHRGPSHRAGRHRIARSERGVRH